MRPTPLPSLTLVAACGVLACGAPRTGEPVVGRSAPSEDAGTWVRQVQSIDVRKPDGTAYELPFFGGFNVPRPQWVDIDSDGDLDLFVQETTDELLFFEREEGPDGVRHVWRPDAFSELQIGEWYRFVDVDGDGDRDLLAEEPFSYVRLYLNTGDAGAPRFELVADTLRDTAGEAIFSDRQNIPNAADIDCDGRLDLFIGRLTGVVTRYEATGEIGEDVAPFRHITDRFEDIEIVADPAAQGGPGLRPLDDPVPPGPGPTMHGANTMALADVDEDGDVDLFWGDFFEPGLLYIENLGSCGSPNLRSEPRPFPLDDPIRTSGYNAPTFGDADGDGDLDLLMGVLGGAYNANTTTADNLLEFVQEDGGFELRTSRFLSQIDVGSESVPALIDLDGDGDLDLLVTNKIDPHDLSTSKVFRFENVGSSTDPSFRERGEFPLDGAYHNAPAFGDLDGDGTLDMVLGTWRKELRLFRGAASADGIDFILADSAFIELTRGSNASPTLGDVDGDGDLDLLVGESSGTLNYYVNAGSADRARFELVSDEYLEIDVGRRSAPTLVDLDGDGRPDLVVGTETGELLAFRNTGGDAPRFEAIERGLPTDLPPFAVPAFADIDADGDLDLFAGVIGGGVLFYENTTR